MTEIAVDAPARPDLANLAATLEAQGRDLADRLQLLYLDVETCERHGQPVELPAPVRTALTMWNPFFETLRARMQQQLATHTGRPVPDAAAERQAHTLAWQLGADDVPKILITRARRTNADWVLAVLASAPERAWAPRGVLDVLLENGWSTSSPDPLNLIANTMAKALSQGREIQRVGRGLYSWRAPEPAEGLAVVDGERPTDPTPTVDQTKDGERVDMT